MESSCVLVKDRTQRLGLWLICCKFVFDKIRVEPPERSTKFLYLGLELHRDGTQKEFSMLSANQNEPEVDQEKVQIIGKN